MRNATSSRFLSAAGLAALLVALAVPAPPGIRKLRQARLPHRLPTGTLRPRSRIKAILRSPSTIRISLSCATCASLRCRPGESLLRFMDIAASINPATVHFRSLTEPAKLNVLEQNYEYDLLDPNKLLQKFVGREVTLVRAEIGQRHDGI